MVAMSELSHRFFEEVRTKRNLSYAVSARLGSTSVPMGRIYVTTVEPNTTLRSCSTEIRRLQTEPVSPYVPRGTKSVYLTEFLMGNESVEGQGAMLASATAPRRRLPARAHAARSDPRGNARRRANVCPSATSSTCTWSSSATRAKSTRPYSRRSKTVFTRRRERRDGGDGREERAEASRGRTWSTHRSGRCRKRGAQ